MNINMRSVILIGIAILIAGVAAFLARSLVTTPEVVQVAAKQEAPANTQVLVANKTIPTGFFLKRDDLEWQSWPDNNVNVNYIQKSSENSGDNQIQEIVGSVAKLPIVAGEPIISGQVVKPGSQGFMAAVLSPGNRAVSININSKSGISGFVFPGDMVDILLTHEVQFEENGEPVPSQVTETVMKDIRVLAIDTLMNNETNTPAIGKIATFEVTPKQAEKIALISRMGEISLSLRSLAVESEDDASVTVSMNNTDKTITYEGEVSVVAGGSANGPGSKIKKVRILRAEQIQEVSFTNSEKKE